MGCGLSRSAVPWDKRIDGPLDREMLIKSIFEKCDDNKNGTLSVPEFRQLAAKQTELHLRLQDAVFQLIDTNHDGKLSMEECGPGAEPSVNTVTG